MSYLRNSLSLVILLALFYKSQAICDPPLYGIIDYQDENRVAISCQDGFQLVGPSEGMCDKETETLDVNVGCMPNFGEDGCGDSCPEDLTYLFDVVLVDSSVEEETTALQIEQAFQMRGRSPTHRKTFCLKACKSDMSICLRITQKKARKRCIMCFARDRCGSQFWG